VLLRDGKEEPTHAHSQTDGAGRERHPGAQAGVHDEPDVGAKVPAPESIDFDLVVFDEASQVRPVDAFGSILRGDQTVVVGDNKQLPPTSFFDSAIETGGDDFEQQASDQESILDLFRSRGAPEQMLQFHYRSRHESLIAVSNKEFYDNNLNVFPSPDAEREKTGLFFNHLPDTTYDRGGSRTNKGEAKEVARRVMEHARSEPELVC